MPQESKMSKFIEIEWLQKNLFAKFTDDEIATIEPLKIVKNTLEILQGIATSNLFRLTSNDEPWSVREHQLYDLEEELVYMANRAAFVVERTAKNEAYTRCVLNLILLSCVAQEKSLAQQTASTRWASKPSSRPSTPEPVRLKLQFETALRYPVKYKGEPRIVTGFADYTLWHSQESMGTNLVVVLAKRRGLINSAKDQVIASMGIIHRTRVDEGRKDALVHGVSTDTNQFRFWRIDNDSQLSRSRIYEWEMNEPREITSFLRYMIRAAIASSPSSPLVEAGAKREVSLVFSGDQARGRRFDHDVGAPGLDEPMVYEREQGSGVPDLP